MANIVSELKAALGPGQRSSKYKVKMNMPQASGQMGGKVINTLAKSASFPGVTQGPIEVFTQGRKFILPGETDYENSWSMTFHQTEGHELRREFLKWMKAMDDWHDNKHQGNLVELMTDVEVSQLDHNEEEAVTYLFKDMFPQSVGTVEVNDTTQNEIQEFEVTFQFTSWVVLDDE